MKRPGAKVDDTESSLFNRPRRSLDATDKLIRYEAHSSVKCTAPWRSWTGFRSGVKARMALQKCAFI
jgi:hypothetical protein